MSNQNVEDTSPTKVQPSSAATVKLPKGSRRWLWIAAGILAIVLVSTLGGLLGYRSALRARLQKEADQLTIVTTTQYQLGVADLEAGHLETARDRFEYVIALDPTFPGAADRLAEVMLAMATVATSTPASTPTVLLTPTPDTRTEDQLYAHAQQLMRAKDWNNAILTLDTLRTANLQYHPLDVDGMYYIALRFRGIDKITLEGNLEGGIYDLALSETFAPIDKEADSFRTWARYYLTGVSFWEVDWEKVVYYFSQIYQALPNLRDGSNYTAVERFRLASRFYGDQLAEKGEYCMARDQYLNALSISDDPALGPTATAVQLICEPPTATPAPFTATPTATEEGLPPPPVETTETPVEEATPTPTATEGGG